MNRELREGRNAELDAKAKSKLNESQEVFVRSITKPAKVFTPPQTGRIVLRVPEEKPKTDVELANDGKHL